jgi:predicted esterase YcpF (UPF0227 family)
MREHYKGAPRSIVDSGDHALNDFGGQFEVMMDFLRRTN